MLKRLAPQWEVFKRYRYLLRNLVQRDITVKYRRSILGLAWSFLRPVMMMLIMTAVFMGIFEQNIDYFPVYLLSAQVIFNFFGDATSSAMSSIMSSSALIKKVYIPKYLFPFEKVLFEFINALCSLVALVVVILVVGSPITPWMLLFPIPLILVFFFNLGLGLLLSSAVVFFRDIQHLYGVVVLALNYLTPVFYPESLLTPTMRGLIKINPLYWYVAFFRQVVLYGKAPTPAMWGLCCFWSAFMMIVGLLVIKKTQDRFILYI